MDGRGNTGARVRHVVTSDKPQRLRGLSPTGTGAGTGSGLAPVMDLPRSRRRESPSPVLVHRVERGKPVSRRPQGREGSRQAPQRRGGDGGGKKPMPPWSGAARGGTITQRASGQTSRRCGGTRDREEPRKGARHRTADAAAGAASHLSTAWQALPWQTVPETVRRRHARLVQAPTAGQGHKGHALPHVRTHSLSGKALAVRRGTAHPGQHTPGSATVRWQDPASTGRARHQR